MRLNPLLIAGLLLAAAAIHAADKKTDGAIDSTAAFARLKTLVGEWEANTSMGKARVTYELIAGGSSLVERESAERMPAMMTVYHMDGSRLLLTHYCMTGNQPRMQAQTFDPKTGEVQFRFLDATNMVRHDAIHMHNATFRIVDKDHFTSDWELYENGQRKTTESFQYARVR
jgi:FtsP/CotA-like multicopper oxidase with cupredoxin domain